MGPGEGGGGALVDGGAAAAGRPRRTGWSGPARSRPGCSTRAARARRRARPGRPRPLPPMPGPDPDDVPEEGGGEDDAPGALPDDDGVPVDSEGPRSGGVLEAPGAPVDAPGDCPSARAPAGRYRPRHAQRHVLPEPQLAPGRRIGRRDLGAVRRQPLPVVPGRQPRVGQLPARPAERRPGEARHRAPLRRVERGVVLARRADRPRDAPARVPRRRRERSGPVSGAPAARPPPRTARIPATSCCRPRTGPRSGSCHPRRAAADFRTNT